MAEHLRLRLVTPVFKVKEIRNNILFSTQERKLKDLKMKTAVNQKLIESGERERLKEVLRTRLIECGWRDQLKAYCKEIVNKKGVDNVTVDDLVVEITPKGRALVPDAVKRELLQRIKAFIAKEVGQ